jgi:hypothetical protein
VESAHLSVPPPVVSKARKKVKSTVADLMAATTVHWIEHLMVHSRADLIADLMAGSTVL